MPSGQTHFQTAWLSSQDCNGHEISQWCKPVVKEPYKAFCTLCSRIVGCDNAGKAQLLNHAKGQNHKNLAKVKLSSSQQKLAIITTAPAKAEKSTTSSRFLLNPSEKEQVQTAEILWVLKMCADDASFASCDGVSDLFRRMFGGEISKNFQMSRTKATYLVADGIGPYLHSELVRELKETDTKYTLQFDETTTLQNQKQLDIIIRFWSEYKGELVIAYLTSCFFGHAKGVDVAKTIISSLEKLNIPLKNLVSLSSDGPNVNKTIWKKIDCHLKEHGLPGLLDFIPCNLHVVHNSFRAGLQDYGSSVEQMCIDLYYWFKQSPCRKEDFAKILADLDFEEKFFVRHVQSRWLTLGPALERIVVHYEAIKEYFLIFLPAQAQKDRTSKFLERNEKYRRICQQLNDKFTPIRMNFLISLSKMFQPFLTIFQTEGPLIHVLHTECTNLIHTLLGRFMKSTCLNTKLHDIDIYKEENHLPKDQIQTGNVITPPDLQIKLMKSCYTTVAKYLLKNLPVNNTLLRDMTALGPMNRASASDRSVKKLAIALPHVIPEQDIDILLDEFKMYKNDNTLQKFMLVTEEKYGSDQTPYQRVDRFWSSVCTVRNSAGLPKYPILMKLVKACVTVAHGNADVERSLSFNKNVVSAERVSLSNHTLIALRCVKDAVRCHGHLPSFPVSKGLLNAHQNANRNYKIRMEVEKQEREKNIAKKEEKQTEKTYIEAEKVSKEREGLKKKESTLCAEEKKLKDDLAIAQELFSDGNKKLAKALNEKSFTQAAVAQTILDTAKTKINNIEKAIKTCSENRKSIDKKRKRLLDSYQKDLSSQKKSKM